MALNAVFIGGSPRSGTTLLGTLLQCIPDACVTHESRFKFHRKWDDFSEKNQFISLLEQDWQYKAWNLSKIDYESCLSERDFYEKLVQSYCNGRPAYWIDHTPYNIRQFYRLRSIFPQSKFIHLVRDGRAVANSIMPLEWGPNSPRTAAREWTDYVGVGLATQVMHPGDVTMVKYETLIAKPVDTLNKLFAFIGIDHRIGGINELDLDIRFLPLSMRTGQHQNVGKLPDISNASKWQTELSDRAIAEFEHHAHGLLSALGYQVGSSGKRPSKMSLFLGMLVEKWRSKVINPPKYRAIRGIE